MEKEKITAEMIAPCGLDCALCKRALEKVNPCPGCLGSDENKPAFCASECGIILCRKRKRIQVLRRMPGLSLRRCDGKGKPVYVEVSAV